MRSSAVVLTLSFALLVIGAGCTTSESPRGASASDAGGRIFTAPSSTLQVQLPAGFVPQLNSLPAKPNYFYATGAHVIDGRKVALNVSGWFEPAERFKDIQGFWANESRAIPRARNVAFNETGQWKIVSYSLPLTASITQHHLRAHWVQAGTWIDLHVSTVSNDAADVGAQQLTRFLQDVTVSPKP